ncbi:MAG: HAD family phosphatase [Isosphaeraceae bacterium]
MSPPRALLFDFDGVIADTENHHIAAWQRTLAAIGWVVSDEVCQKAMEKDDRIFLAELFTEREIKGGDVEGWVRRKQTLTQTLLADAPRIYPGIAALLERLRGKVTLGVVSTTWRDNVTLVLEAARLRSYFDLIIAKEDVVLPKPDPEPYRRAVESLSLSPEQAVAIEDSPGGIASALGAGLRALAVGHRHGEGPWTCGAPFLADLRQTEAVIQQLGLSV